MKIRTLVASALTIAFTVSTLGCSSSTKVQETQTTVAEAAPEMEAPVAIMEAPSDETASSTTASMSESEQPKKSVAKKGKKKRGKRKRS